MSSRIEPPTHTKKRIKKEKKKERKGGMKIIRNKKRKKERSYTTALSQPIKKANSTKPSKRISLAAQLLTSVAASARHYDDDMIGVAFYE